MLTHNFSLSLFGICLFYSILLFLPHFYLIVLFLGHFHSICLFFCHFYGSFRIYYSPNLLPVSFALCLSWLISFFCLFLPFSGFIPLFLSFSRLFSVFYSVCLSEYNFSYFYPPLAISSLKTGQ